MTEKEKLALLEETMELDEGTLNAEMKLDDIEEYDSLTKLSIIVMIEDEFGKRLNADDFKKFEKVADIINIMEA